MEEIVTIKKRFVGPPGMGNGGYVCGILAQKLSGIVEATLKQPVPLEKDLSLQFTQDQCQLLDGNVSLAESQRAPLTLRVPTPPDYKKALAGRRRYLDTTQHPFPNCFVCGPNRKQGDGLQIYPTLIPEQNLVAAVWEPDVSLAETSEFVASQFLWAALDCPGGIMAIANRPRPIVLGRMTAELLAKIRPNMSCLVIGWPLAKSGRKHTVGTAIFTEEGQLIGKALAIWIELQ